MFKEKNFIKFSIPMAALAIFFAFSQAFAANGYYIVGDGSGGGGGATSNGWSGVGGAGGSGGSGADTITGTSGNDIIFGDGSGGGGAYNAVGGFGGGGADVISGGDGDDVIFGDGFDGKKCTGWCDNRGGLGGGGGGGGFGFWGSGPGGGGGGIGAGGGGGGGIGGGGGTTTVSGVGSSGGSGGGNGGSSATDAENHTGAGGSNYNGQAGGGGGAFGGAAGGAAGGSTGNAGSNGDTNQHSYSDSTGSIKTYFTLANLRALFAGWPYFGNGNDTINGGSGTNDLFGLGGNNTFIIDSIDNPAKNRLWDFKTGDVLKLKNDGIQISQSQANAILAAANTADYDGDGVADDVELIFNGKPIDLMNVVINPQAASNGDIMASDSIPTVNMNDDAVSLDTSYGRYYYWTGGGTILDLDGSAGWNGATLEFEITQGGVSNNNIFFQGFSSTLPPKISITGTNVYDNGTLIGTVSPSGATSTGVNAKVTFTFNGSVTNADVLEFLNGVMVYAPSSNNAIITMRATQAGATPLTYSDSRVLGSAGAAPTVTDATTSTDGQSVDVTFSKTMFSLVGKQNQFLVRVNGSPNVVTSISRISDTVYRLALAKQITVGQTTTLDYIQGDAFSQDYGILQSFSGVSVVVITNISEVVDSQAPVPGNSGTLGVENLRNTSLTLTWNKAADNSTPTMGLKYFFYQNAAGKVAADMDTVDEVQNVANATLLNSGGTDDIAYYDVSGLSAGTYYFNVVVQDLAGNKAVYQVKSQAIASPPTVAAGAVNRTGDTQATIKFTPSNAGRFYYELVPSGNPEPSLDTSATGAPCTASETTVTDPGGLTAGAKDMYLAVKDYAGNTSSQLLIAIPNFINQWTLTYTAAVHGSINGSSTQEIIDGQNGTEVTAVPDTGYHFVSWSDSLLTAARTDLAVSSSANLTASFAIDQFALNYSAGSHGSLTGTASQTVNYGADGTPVTAVATAGYSFVRWSDNVLTAARTDLNVHGNISVTALFTVNEYALNYLAQSHGSINGSAAQTVTNGQNGTEVTAVADTGYHFVSWSDNVTTAARTDLNVDRDITVTAAFAINQYALVYSAPANGSIQGTARQTVDRGSSGTPVTAVAASGYQFVDWSDGLTANPRLDSNVTASLAVTARFQAQAVPGNPSFPVVMSDPSLSGDKITVGANNASQIMISDRPDFGNSSWQIYQNDLDLSRFSGAKTVFIKFKSRQGGMSKTYVIDLSPKNPAAPSIAPASISPSITASITASNYNFTRNLETGSSGADVIALQKFLNSNGFIITRSGPGSPGNETGYFGKLTQIALIKFQLSQKIDPAAGYFGPLTRAAIYNKK